jgi:hypothetical protein
LKKGIPSQITATSRDEEEDEDGISSQSADSTNHGIDAKKTPVLKEALVRSSMLTAEANKTKVIDHTEVASTSHKISDERLSRWVGLLAKRPSTKDSDTMSAWLMEVLAVSDLETPLPNSKLDKDTMDHKKPTETSVGLPKKDTSTEEEEENLALKDKLHNGIEEEMVGEELNGGILKKKRPADLLEAVEDHNTEMKVDNGSSNTKPESSSSSFATGSFAEWKERKKQKMQSKGLIAPGP